MGPVVHRGRPLPGLGDTYALASDDLAFRNPHEVQSGLFRLGAIDDDGPLPALAEVRTLAGVPHVALGLTIFSQLLQIGRPRQHFGIETRVPDVAAILGEAQV